VEIRERPELAGKPVIVGGSPTGRGVVSAANYVARRYGVHSAMPTATALRLCPEAVLIRPRHELYAQVSRRIRAIFERFTPEVEPLSLDEAFLDVTASEALFGPAEGIARRIKEAIREELRLVASVGVAPNKFVAKIASDVDKPDGLRVVGPDEVQAFLDPLPVSRLWGVGKVTSKVFEKLGIQTIGQFRRYPVALVREHFGNAGEQLLALANGRDERPVEAEREVKSVSNETTFATDLWDREVVRAVLLDLCDQVAARLRAQNLKGRTIHLKIRYADFTTLTRSHSLAEVTDATDVIWATVGQLFEHRLPPSRLAFRLVGVGVSGFDAAPQQCDLGLETAEGRREKIDEVTDAIRARFGREALVRGATQRRRRGE
jgi:DNA polymerase-4